MSRPFNYLRHQFIYTCLQCGRQVYYREARSGCPECKHFLFKVARRGTGYPEAFTPPDKKEEDPYYLSPIMTPGDEDTQGGMGTRVRGKTFPQGWTAQDNYENQRNMDIPYSDHMFVDGYPTGEGANDGTFFDPDSPLSSENMVAEQLFSRYRTPVGPHNMQKYRGVFDRVRSRQKGV